MAALLSAEVLERIEREAAKYPPEQRRSAVLSALAIAQDQHGWLSSELMEEVATVLRMPPVLVYEVATFYTMYNVKEGECLGACGDAPVMLVDNKRMESFMTPQKIDALVEELK